MEPLGLPCASPSARPTDLLCVVKLSRSALRTTLSQGTLAVMRLWLSKAMWRTGCLGHRGGRSYREGPPTEHVRPLPPRSRGRGAARDSGALGAVCLSAEETGLPGGGVSHRFGVLVPKASVSLTL